MMHDALMAKGVDSTLVLIANGQHGGSPFDDQKYKQMISDFLDEHLRGPLPLRRRAAR